MFNRLSKTWTRSTAYLVILLLLIGLADHPRSTQAQADQCMSIPYAYNLIPLISYFNPDRLDNFTAGDPRGQRDALNQGYTESRVEGWAYLSRQPGTVPMYSYFNPDRMDNFTTGDPKGQRDALNQGYTRIRVEGWVYPSHQPGTIPMYSYFSSARMDNFTTGTGVGEQDALNTGYTETRIEGWVYPTAEVHCGSVPID